jgi:hypothetical protein
MKEKSWNERRADWAQAAVDAFAETTRMDEAGEPRRTQVMDLLADLRHLCDRWGLDFDKLSQEGLDHYRAEIAEDGPKCRRAKG